MIGRAAGLELARRTCVTTALDERRADGARHDDLLDQFMHFELDGHSLDDDEVVNIMHMFTIAGLDTVTSSLSCIVGLVRRPTPRNGAASSPNPSVLPRAIEEIMRYESPVPSGGARVGARATPRSTACRSSRARWSTCAGPAPTSIRRRSSTRSTPISTARRTATSRSRPASTAASVRTWPGPSCARAIDQFHRRIPEYWVTDGDEIRVRVRRSAPGPAPAAELRARGAEPPVEFGLTEEQALLRDTVRDLVARTCPPEVAKAWDDDATPPGELSARARRHGLFGLPVPRGVGRRRRHADRARDRRRAARPGQPRRRDVLLGPLIPALGDRRVGDRRAARRLAPGRS